MAKKLKFAIVGCGRISKNHLEALTSGNLSSELVAVCDLIPEKAKEKSEKYKVPFYTDYHKMMESHPEIDVVNIATPTGMHARHVIDISRHGKNIIVEKPMALRVEDCDAMMKACADNKCRLFVVQQNRFNKAVQAARKALDSGRFGKQVLGTVRVRWKRTQKYYEQDNWHGTWALDGGVMSQQASHHLDLLQWFMGPVASVRAQTRRALHEQLEVEDLAVVTLEFVNGAFGVIEGSTAIWPGHPARVEVHGTEGSAYVEDGALKFFQFQKRRAGDAKIEKMLSQESELGSGAGDPLSSLKIEGHRRQILDFAQAIQNDRPPLIDGREGRNAVALIEAIYKAADTGKTIKL